MRISFRLNGKPVQTDVAPFQPLDVILREILDVRSLPSNCGAGDCGICTVSLNGRALCACMVAALHADQADIWTAEGLENHPDPRAAAILRAKELCEADACGACLPAQAMTALTEGSSAASMVDVLCRCGVWHAFMERIEEGTGD